MKEREIVSERALLLTVPACVERGREEERETGGERERK